VGKSDIQIEKPRVFGVLEVESNFCGCNLRSSNWAVGNPGGKRGTVSLKECTGTDVLRSRIVARFFVVGFPCFSTLEGEAQEVGPREEGGSKKGRGGEDGKVVIDGLCSIRFVHPFPIFGINAASTWRIEGAGGLRGGTGGSQMKTRDQCSLFFPSSSS